jgi:dissimilatory sulfite reductase (desulfoviridin) alpha/beta subunit
LSTHNLTCVECMNIWKVAQGESMKPREKKMDFRLGGNKRRETTRFGYSKFYGKRINQEKFVTLELMQRNMKKMVLHVCESNKEQGVFL